MNAQTMLRAAGQAANQALSTDPNAQLAVVAQPGPTDAVSIPVFDANGNVVKDASGAPLMQSVSAMSDLGKLANVASKGPWMGLLMLAVYGAVVFAAAFYGAKMGVKRGGGGMFGSRRSGRSRRSHRSRGAE